MSAVVEFIKLGKKGKQVLKKVLKGNTPIYLSSVRRIERVKTKQRICAMTFDDGPFNLPPSPDTRKEGKSLTLTLLEVLEKYDAKGTFDIIGDTSGNYDDVPGKEGTSAWGGVKFDHYPDIFKDDQGGALHCPELVQRIIDGGHELSNHGYQHRLFGTKNVVYAKRVTFNDIDEVVDDLRTLHNFVKENFNYEMKLSRPPHYVDHIKGGHSSYDAYHELGYQYMAASYDGAGWLPCATYQEEVEVMYKGMEAALQENPDLFCGQIIFQKDGYNMARRTPVADGLEEQLKLLKKYGYKVVTVSELMALSMFEDAGEGDVVFEDATELISKGYCVAYRDNTLKANTILKKGELAFMFYGKEGTHLRTELLKQGVKSVCSDVQVKHPYSGAIKLGLEQKVFELKGNKFDVAANVSAAEYNAIAARYFKSFEPLQSGDAEITHEAVIKNLALNERKMAEAVIS